MKMIPSRDFLGVTWSFLRQQIGKKKNLQLTLFRCIISQMIFLKVQSAIILTESKSLKSFIHDSMWGYIGTCSVPSNTVEGTANIAFQPTICSSIVQTRVALSVATGNTQSGNAHKDVIAKEGLITSRQIAKEKKGELLLGQGEEANPGCLYDAGAGNRGDQQAISLLYSSLSYFSGFFLTTCKVVFNGRAAH